MKKHNPIAIALILATLLPASIFAQEPPNQAGAARGSGVTVELGLAVALSTTPKIEFSSLRTLENYEGVIATPIDFRLRFHLNDSDEVWFTRSRSIYKKDDDASRQPDGRVIPEKGTLNIETDRLEIPFFLMDETAAFNSHFSLGAGVLKAGYETEFDGTRFQDQDYMRLYTVGLGLHYRFLDDFNVSLNYNHDFIDTADNFSFALDSVVLVMGYRLF